jgi:hypothetical protein
MIEIDRDSVEGVVIGVSHGPLTLKDMREAAERLWQQETGTEVRVMWDLRESRFNLSADEVSSLAQFVRQRSPFTKLRAAFVVAADLEFGLVRMFEIMRDTKSARTNVFRDRDKALEWLTGSEP